MSLFSHPPLFVFGYTETYHVMEEHCEALAERAGGQRPTREGDISFASLAAVVMFSFISHREVEKNNI